jgi:ribonucleoside-diphosphate reductase alpha chain
VRLHVRAPRHQVVIVGAGVGRFAEEIGFLGEGKRGDLGAYLRSFVRGPYRQRFVAHVEGVAADGAEWVYDLTEPLTHSFVANGFVVHNCAEQPLPAWGVCTLGHVNLARMVAAGGREVDWERLGRTVRAGVRFLDDVVSATPYFFDENRRNQERERRVGLGTLGLAELMIRLGHRYGAPEAEPFLHRLFSFIRDEAYLASADLAAEKGPFPAFDAERYLRSGFCERLPEGVRERIRRDGIRNVTLLTQAPTGTVGTMVNTSTGIEPFFSFQFFRQSRLGFDEQWVPLAAEWLEAHPGESLPAHFVSAMQLSPEEHIRVQAVVQQYTDSSISKTANAPADYTREQTQRLYMLAYEAGCKGVTIYRDGSRQEQVLHDASAAAPEAPAGEPAPAPRAAASPPAAPSPRPRPDVIRGQTVRMAAPEGTVFVTLNEHPDGTPFEVFARAGKAGSDLTASVDAIARLASLALRSGIPVAAVVDQLEGIGGRNSVGFGPRRVRSVADAIARAMQMVWVGDGAAPEPAAAAEAPRRGDLCPACGEYALVYQEGCVTCSSCGHSEC